MSRTTQRENITRTTENINHTNKVHAVEAILGGIFASKTLTCLANIEITDGGFKRFVHIQGGKKTSL